METKLFNAHTTAETYELVASIWQNHYLKSTTAYYVRLNEEKCAEILIKESGGNIKVAAYTDLVHDGIVMYRGESISSHTHYQEVTRECIAEFIKVKSANEPISNLKTYGILADQHNWLATEAGLSTDFWDVAEKHCDITLKNRKTTKIKFWAEAPYFFRAEFVTDFPGAKFDFFTEDGDLHKGCKSDTLKLVTEANFHFFDVFNDFNAEKLFGKQTCIVKNKPLNGKSPCVDCLRKMFFDKRADPRFKEFDGIVGNTTISSFTEIFSRCRREGKSWKQIMKENNS